MKTTNQMFIENEIERLQNEMDKLANQYPLATMGVTQKIISDKIDAIFEEMEALRENL